MHVEVNRVDKQKYFEDDKNIETSEVIRDRVKKAREIQLQRYRGSGIFFNSQLKNNMIKKYIKLDEKTTEIIKDYFDKLGLSARAYNKIIKVARTIADLDGSIDVKYEHVAEAFQYRNLSNKYISN
ncbi:MAG: Magnesium chelatase, subunit ChlI C-terminal [Thermoanaerobacterium thermosaccharolyticum]